MKQQTKTDHVYKALNENRFFKLVCGASLTDVNLVEKLVYIFTLAGAHVIDLAPSADVIFAARKGIKKAISNQQSVPSPQSPVLSPVLMASIQLDIDPHFRKAEVNYDVCDLCGVCIKVCPTGAFSVSDRNGDTAIRRNSEFIYLTERCFGCGLCPECCHVNALSMVDIQPTPKEKLLEMRALGIESIELHFGKNYLRIEEVWDSVKDLVKDLKLLSFSIGSNLLNDTEIREAAKLSCVLAGSGIILQCDGIPMSGAMDKNNKSGNNNVKTYLHVTRIIQEEKLPVYLQISGGTNHNSYRETVEAGLKINGVAVGSYARKLLMPYLDKLDDNDEFEKALNIAVSLVNSVGGGVTNLRVECHTRESGYPERNR